MKLHLMSYSIYILKLEDKAYNFSHYFKVIPLELMSCSFKNTSKKKNVKKVGKLLWRETNCWFVETMEGYTSNLQQGQVNKGGTFIVMDPNCTKFVSHYGTTWGNQVQWLLLNGMFRGNLGFINIYQPSKLV